MVELLKHGILLVLQDASGALQPGAIANIVDDVGAAASLSDGQPKKVSVDMSISYLSIAKVNVRWIVFHTSVDMKLYTTNVNGRMSNIFTFSLHIFVNMIKLNLSAVKVNIRFHISLQGSFRQAVLFIDCRLLLASG
jgi:hypothetical protein